MSSVNDSNRILIECARKAFDDDTPDMVRKCQFNGCNAHTDEIRDASTVPGDVLLLCEEHRSKFTLNLLGYHIRVDGVFQNAWRKRFCDKKVGKQA